MTFLVSSITNCISINNYYIAKLLNTQGQTTCRIAPCNVLQLLCRSEGFSSIDCKCDVTRIIKILHPSGVTHMLATFTQLLYMQVNSSTLTEHHKHISIAGTCGGNHPLNISSIFTYIIDYIFFSCCTATQAILNKSIKPERPHMIK